MEDYNMQEMEEDQPDNPSSPPRKKPKTDGEDFSTLSNPATHFESSPPNTLRHKIKAHEEGCTSILFLNNSNLLISGGRGDNVVKLWDTTTGKLTCALQGFQGSVYDLAISPDNGLVAAALTSRKICIWDLNSGQTLRTLDGFNEKVCAVDISKLSNRYLVGAYNGHCVKIWDLQQDDAIAGAGAGAYFDKNCNVVCFVNDDQTICSGHQNRTLKFNQLGRFGMGYGSDIPMHTQPVTSVCGLRKRNGEVVLTTGRDNWPSLVDVGSHETWGGGSRRLGQVATNWSRSCVGPGDEFAAVGSTDGSVWVWSVGSGRVVKGNSGKKMLHDAAVVCCSWGSGRGSPLASADCEGTICVWS